MLVLFGNGHKARHVLAENQGLPHGASSAASPGYWQGGRSEVEQPELESTPIQDAAATDGRLAWNIAMPTHVHS